MKELLNICRESNDSMLISGKHGIGKSEMIKEYCTENNFHLETLFISLLDESDLQGLPTPSSDNKSTVWLRPEWISSMHKAKEAGKEVVLFLDELNRGTRDVLQCTLELILNKQINGHKLPEGTFIVSAINPSDDDYHVQELDPAMINRFFYHELSVDAEKWLSWAEQNDVHSIIRRFISRKNDYLNFTTETEIVSCTPRSWTKLSDILKTIEKTNNEEYLYNAIKAKVGKVIGAEFFQFYNEYANMVSIEDIKGACTDNLEESISNISNIIKDQEPITILDFMKNLTQESINNIDNNFNTINDNIPNVAFLHAAPIELTASFLKDLSRNDFVNYRKLARLDPSIFEKIVNKKFS